MGTVGQNFQRVENARAGTVEIGVPIYKINSRRIAPCGNLLFQQIQFLQGLIQFITTGFDHHHIWVYLGQVFPADNRRGLPALGDAHFPPDNVDHFGKPHATDINGIDPFYRYNIWLGPSRYGEAVAHGLDPLIDFLLKLVSALFHAQRLGGLPNIVPDISQPFGPERNDFAIQKFPAGFFHLREGNGANITQVLSHDEVGF